MPNTFFGLSIGVSGIYAANAGLNTTAHNIANTETKGFSRQILNTRAGNALPMYGTNGMQGVGVTVTGVKQERSEYFDRKYWSNSTIAGFYSTHEYYMASLENYYNEIQLEGFTATFNKMYDSLQQVSKNSSDLTVRTEVTKYSQTFAEYFNYLSNSLKSVQEDLNFEVKNEVDHINSLGTQIAGLTKQINVLEITGVYANDLRDQRALLVDDLSRIVDISVKETFVSPAEVGVTNYDVYIGQNRLVQTYESYDMKVVPRKEKVNQNDIDGIYDIIWSEGQNFSALTGGGNLQALFEVRDGNNANGLSGTTSAGVGDQTITVTQTNINSVNLLNIPTNGMITIGNMDYTYNGFQVTKDDDGNFEYEFSLNEEFSRDVDEIEVVVGRNVAYKGVPYYMAQMNEFVRTYSKAFNDLHKSGMNLNGGQGLDFFNATQTVTGENYVFETSPEFEDTEIVFNSKTGVYALEEPEEKNYGSYYFMTAGNFGVTKKVYEDPREVAAASQIVDGQENNDIAMALLALKGDNRIFRQGTPEGYLQSLIAEVGIDAEKAKQFAKSQENIVNNIQGQRLSVSGVDSEEEGMNMIRYKYAYDLSSKVISTMNEIYDRLINYMGV